MDFGELGHFGGRMAPSAVYEIAIGLGNLFLAAYQPGLQLGAAIAAGDNLAFAVSQGIAGQSGVITIP